MKRQIILKTSDEIALIEKSADLLGRLHGELTKKVRPGVRTIDLDSFAETYIRDHSGVPSFKGFNGFPYTLCISVNDVVVHGFPSKYELKEGDIISIDCGVKLNGFHADSAYTHPVGEVKPEVLKFLKNTKQSLYTGIAQVVANNRVGDIGFAIQQFVEAAGYSVVRPLVGHGVGRSLHEAPEVPNYGKRGQGAKLMDGIVIAIEPMVNMGKKEVVQDSDGWTIRTSDRSYSAHYEHTVALVDGKAKILTTFKHIEEVYNL